MKGNFGSGKHRIKENSESTSFLDLKNEPLTLRPATFADKRNIYHWLAHSNLTIEMLGPPNFPDHPAPTWEEFEEDYLEHYFDGSKPSKGRCFVIVHQGQEIGQINYNDIDLDSKSTEIDIWLADRKFAGKGHGTQAIKMMCHLLHESLGCETVYIAPSSRNVSAIKAYRKAGFVEVGLWPETFLPDYDDAVLLEKKMK